MSRKKKEDNTGLLLAGALGLGGLLWWLSRKDKAPTVVEMPAPKDLPNNERLAKTQHRPPPRVAPNLEPFLEVQAKTQHRPPPRVAPNLEPFLEVQAKTQHRPPPRVATNLEPFYGNRGEKSKPSYKSIPSVAPELSVFNSEPTLIDPLQQKRNLFLSRL